MSKFRTKILLFALLGLMFPSTSQATVLTFDMDKTPAFDGLNPVDKFFGTASDHNFPEYGDRVDWTGSPSVVDVVAPAVGGRPTTTFHYGPADGQTPNVVVDYGGGAAPSGFDAFPAGEYYFDHPAMGDGSPTARFYLNSTDLQRYLTLTADPGYEVLMDAFKIATFDTYTFRYLRLVGIDEANVETTLWSVGDPVTGNVAVNNQTFNTVDFGTLAYHSIALDFQPLSNIHIYYALDNVQFSQQIIPEPASLVMLGFAMGGLAVRRRRPKA